ncbi:hypothetical protein [Streptomyces sp. NBC_01361]|nr:hypothetical protein [Streptomyces sp. NBC_01361]
MAHLGDRIRHGLGRPAARLGVAIARRVGRPQSRAGRALAPEAAVATAE